MAHNVGIPLTLPPAVPPVPVDGFAIHDVVQNQLTTLATVAAGSTVIFKISILKYNFVFREISGFITHSSPHYQ